MGRAFRGQQAPAFVVGVLIEAGQDDAAARQAGHGREQISGRGNAAGRSGRNHLAGRRRSGPAFGLGGQEPVAPIRRVDCALLGQALGPAAGDEAQEIEGDLPMLGIIGGHQPIEVGEIQPLGLNLIDQARQFGGEANGMVRVEATARLLDDQFGQQQAAAQFGDRGRHGQGLGIRRRLGHCERQLVLVHIADRRQARQQHRLARAQAQEGFGQGADGAPGRQQDAVVGQGQGVVTRLVQDAPGQGIEKRHARRDGVNAGPGRPGRGGGRFGLRHRGRHPGRSRPRPRPGPGGSRHGTSGRHGADRTGGPPPGHGRRPG